MSVGIFLWKPPCTLILPSFIESSWLLCSIGEGRGPSYVGYPAHDPWYTEYVDDVPSDDVTILQASSWAMSPTRWLPESWCTVYMALELVMVSENIFLLRDASRGARGGQSRWPLGLRENFSLMPMTLFGVLSRKDDRLIVTVSHFGYEDNLWFEPRLRKNYLT